MINLFFIVTLCHAFRLNGSFAKQSCTGKLGRVLGSAGGSSSCPTSPVRLSRREYHEVTGDIICPSMVLGHDHLRDPRLNKGLAFTLEERQVLGIHGLQPARFKTQEEQLELCQLSIARYKEDLNRYLYLTDLQVKLFTISYKKNIN